MNNIQEEIIVRRIRDTSLLFDMIEKETDKDVLKLWHYHVLLNAAIIRNVINNDYKTANIMIAEIRESTQRWWEWECQRNENNAN